VRGYPFDQKAGSAAEMVMDPKMDLFR
jgi:hypothetical protein